MQPPSTVRDKVIKILVFDKFYQFENFCVIDRMQNTANVSGSHMYDKIICSCMCTEVPSRHLGATVSQGTGI